MARRSLQYRIEDDSRDKGKVFRITEMPSDQGEKWAIRALLAIGRNGVEMPQGFEQMGMAGLAEVGINALFKIRYEDAEPLLDELWGCIEIIPDPAKPHVLRSVIAEDIDEVPTRLKLRWEALKLHVDFSKAAALSRAGGKAASRGDSSNTPT